MPVTVAATVGRRRSRRRGRKFGRSDEPVVPLMSEVINRGLPFEDPQALVVTEEMLRFECERCGRMLSAAQTIIKRGPSEVVYSCPYDGAELVVSRSEGEHGSSCYESEGAVTIRVGDEDIRWPDLMERRRSG